jgi:sulfur carrier protein ThiS adenylyltransferase
MDRETMRAIFARATVGIAGAGGLGSNCAVALARAGVGRLVIADFDAVSAPNLDRQYYFRAQVGRPKVEALAENIAAIDPAVAVEAHRVRVDPAIARGLFKECDVIVEAFDDAGAKDMLIETCLAAFPRTPIIGASGVAGVGRFEAIRVERGGNLAICGDFESEVSELLPPVAPRVAIVANLEADLALELLLAAQGISALAPGVKLS